MCKRVPLVFNSIGSFLCKGFVLAGVSIHSCGCDVALVSFNKGQSRCYSLNTVEEEEWAGRWVACCQKRSEADEGSCTVTLNVATKAYTYKTSLMLKLYRFNRLRNMQICLFLPIYYSELSEKLTRWTLLNWVTSIQFSNLMCGEVWWTEMMQNALNSTVFWLITSKSYYYIFVSRISQCINYYIDIIWK